MNKLHCITQVYTVVPALQCYVHSLTGVLQKVSQMLVELCKPANLSTCTNVLGTGGLAFLFVKCESSV